MTAFLMATIVIAAVYIGLFFDKPLHEEIKTFIAEIE